MSPRSIITFGIVAIIAIGSFALPASGVDVKADAFTRKLKEFREQSTSASPETAAKGWLALAEEALNAPKPKPTADGEAPPSSYRWERLMESLPPPAAWEPLSKAIDARRPRWDSRRRPPLVGSHADRR